MSEVIDLFERVQLDLPEAMLNDFVRAYNTALLDVAGLRRWKAYRTSMTFTPHVVVTHGTVVNGDATVTDTEGLFLAAHVGARVFILAEDVSVDPVMFTVAAFTDVNTIELDAAWDLAGQSGDVQITIQQFTWPGPTDFVAAYRMEYDTNNVEYTMDYWKVGEIASTGVAPIEFRAMPTANELMRYWYYRKPTAAVALGDTVDAVWYLEDVLYKKLLLRYIGRMPLEQNQRWLPLQTEAKRDYQEALTRAERVEGGMSGRHGRAYRVALM